MRFTQPLGFNPANDSTLQTGEQIQAMFEADAAIAVGHYVMLDTGNLNGKLAVTLTSAADHRFLGCYQGEGGSGTATSVATIGSTSTIYGKAAADGDFIWVTVYGKAVGFYQDTTTTAADGDALTVVFTDGMIGTPTTTFTAGVVPTIVALEGATPVGIAGKGLTVFVRGI